MRLDKWHDGYQIVLEVKDLETMVKCSGMSKAVDAMNAQAQTEGLKVKRILMPSLMGAGIFSVPVVEASFGRPEP